MENVSWEDEISPVCDRCSCGQTQDEVHVSSMCGYEGVCTLWRKLLELFQTLPQAGALPLAQTFLRQQL
eukprot:1146433-Pelagomonas_calceolata.AAC.13